MATAAPARRLGLLLPSSNTVVEPEALHLLPADGSVSLHVSRFRMTVVSDDAASLDQFAPPAMLAAVELLIDARVELVAWAGTSASWLGFARDDALVAAIRQRFAVPATTAVLALNRRLADLGARSIGLVTPYIAALESRIIDNYAAAGIRTVAARRLDLTENTDYAAVAPERIAALCRDVAAARPDAIVIMCTNLRGAGIAADLTRELAVPVLDSVVVILEHGLGLLSA